MYTLHLDLELQFTPPMENGGPHITFTRPIELPFPAYSGLCIFSTEIDEFPKPEGFMLKDVVWDIDRSVFIARTEFGDSGVPVGAIVNAIQGWLDRGWTLGSYKDTYSDVIQPSKGQKKRRPRHRISWEELERMQENRTPRRPKEFMDEFKAWVRFLAEGYAEGFAYAMDRSSVVLTQNEFKRDGTPDPEWRAWQKLIQEYHDLPERKQIAWQRKVKRYPKWTSLLAP